MPEKTSATQKRRPWKRLFARLGYVLLAIGLIAWEVHEGNIIHSQSCELQTSAPSESYVMKKMYSWVLRLAKLKGSPNVVTVGTDKDLQFVQNNICPAREFTADILRAISTQKPALIAIDKDYGQGVCSPDDTDKHTAALLSAIASINVPVVVGAATTNSSKSNSTSCLAAVAQLFTPAKNGPQIPPNVHTGLTRLNENPLKIPMAWDVYSTDKSKIETANSFALETAELSLPDLKQNHKFSRMIRSPQQPYAGVFPLPTAYEASTLLCAADAQYAKKRWNITCPNPAPPMLDLNGKIVVLGAESTSDQYSILGQTPYGFQLQAAYISALLGGAYLRDIPALWLFIPLVLYYAIAEILLPSMEIHKHPIWPLWHVKHAIVWEIGLFCLTMLIGFFVPLLFHRFPPLEIMLMMMIIFAPRLLIEGWALVNEQMEEREAEKELSS